MRNRLLAVGVCWVVVLAPAVTAQAATPYLSGPEAKRVLVRFLTEQYGYQPGSLVTYCGRVGWRATVPLRNRITCDVAFDGAASHWCGNAYVYETATQYIVRRALYRGYCGE